MPPRIISGGLLTEREAQIAGLLAEGYTKKEIARELCLSVYTVQTHVNHIFRKCGVANKVQLARWWMGAATVEPSQQAVGRSRPPSTDRRPSQSRLGPRALRLGGLAALIAALLLGFSGGLVSKTWERLSSTTAPCKATKLSRSFHASLSSRADERTSLTGSVQPARPSRAS